MKVHIYMEFQWSNFDPPFGNSRELIQGGGLMEFRMPSAGGGGANKLCDEPLCTIQPY